jgi:hypothetical protein
MTSLSAGYIQTNTLTVTGTQSGAIQTTNLDFENLSLISGNLSIGDDLNVSGTTNVQKIDSTDINYKKSDIKTSNKTYRDNATYVAVKSVSKNLDTEPYKCLDGTMMTAEIENELRASNFGYGGTRQIGFKQAVCMNTTFSNLTDFFSFFNTTDGILLNTKKTIDNCVLKLKWTPGNDYDYIKYIHDLCELYISFGYGASLSNDIRNATISQFFHNSGVLLGNYYKNEIQIHDTYVAGCTEITGIVGGIYNNYDPLNIVCKPSATTENQMNEYVVLYDCAKLTGINTLIAPPVLSVFINNVLVQYRAIPFIRSGWAGYSSTIRFPSANNIIGLQNHEDGSNPAFTDLSIYESSVNNSNDVRNLQLFNIQRNAYMLSSGSKYRQSVPFANGDMVDNTANTTNPMFKGRQAIHPNRITFVDASGNPDYSKDFPNDATVINTTATIYGSYQFHYYDASGFTLGSVNFGNGYTLNLTGSMAGHITDLSGVSVAAPDFSIKLTQNGNTYLSNDLVTLRLVYHPCGVLPPWYVENVDSSNCEVTILYNDKPLHKYVRLPSASSYSSTITLNSVSGSLTGTCWVRQIDNFGLEVADSSGNITLDEANNITNFTGPHGFNQKFNTSGFIRLVKCIDVTDGIASGTLNSHDLPIGTTFKYLIKTNTCATVQQIMASGSSFTGPSFSIDVSGLDLLSRQHRIYFIAVYSGLAISKPFYKEIGDTVNNYTYEYGTSMYSNMFTFPNIPRYIPRDLELPLVRSVERISKEEFMMRKGIPFGDDL